MSIAVPLVEVKVIPRANQNAVVEQNGQIVVRTTAPAEDGKANAAALKLLSRHWRLPLAGLSIVRGTAARRKVVRRP